MRNLLDLIEQSKTVRKAVAAGIFTALGTLGALMADGGLTWGEAIIAAGSGLAAAAATYVIPNKPPAGPQD